MVGNPDGMETMDSNLNMGHIDKRGWTAKAEMIDFQAEKEGVRSHKPENC